MHYRNTVFAAILITGLLLSTTAYGQVGPRQRPELHVRDTLTEYQHPELRTNEIIVRFRNEDRFRRIPVTASETVTRALARFENRRDVLYAEPNYIARAFFTPNDTYYQYQWHFGSVNAESAWDTGNGAGAVVAVVDTGIAYENNGFWFRRAPDLAGTCFVAGYDFVNNDTHPNDDEGHGTHVAGTIAQTTNNNNGVAGLAHGSCLMPVKVLDSRGSGSYADVAEGIRFAADNGANVINLSLGGPSPASYLEEALAYAHNKGVTIVAASGNDNAGSVSYPAAYDDYVIAVGATRFDDTRAPYSNYGSSLDLVAPGGDLNVDQNNDGYGDGVLQETFGRRPNSFGYYFYQGTSMATPHVAAAAALVIGAGVATTPSDVRGVLEGTARDLGANGWDSMYGHGIIDAAAALGAAVPPPPPPPDPEPEPEPEPENVPPTADAGVDQSAFTGDSISFDGSGSDDSDGTITLYEWDFGDGENATGVSVSHAYASAGDYTVTLTVTDDDGATDADTVLVLVADVPLPPPPGPDPSAIFSDGFESGFGNWTQDAQNDWRHSSQRSTEGTFSAEVDGRASNASLTSVPIDLSGVGSATVSFSWLIERRVDRREYLAFDISTNGGSSWTEHARLRGNEDAEDVWHDVNITVAGGGEVLLRFRGTMSSSSEDANVDNVVVVGS